MKKYKNKKTDELATTHTPEMVSARFYVVNRGEVIPARFVENSNDWEEIIEKNYEILAYRYKPFSNDYNIWIKKPDGEFSWKNNSSVTASEKYLFNNRQYEIYSVKRLSDGEVFSIGDKYSNLSGVSTIESFYIDGKYVIVKNKEVGQCALDRICKKEKPLFTTEDEVEIFCENQEVFTVGPSLALCTETIKTLLSRTKTKVKAFFIQEKAEEYILMNKKGLSVNDLHKILYDIPANFGSRTLILEKCKEFIKNEK